MDAHAHPQGLDLRRVDLGEPVLGFVGGRERVGSPLEHREHAVPGVRHDQAPVAHDCLDHERVVAGERARHQRRMRLPLLGASFDVAEEERPVDAHRFLSRLAGRNGTEPPPATLPYCPQP